MDTIDAIDTLDSKLAERQLSTKRIYDGCVIHVRVDEVLLPDGNKSVREIVEHNGAVSVLPIDENGKVYMVKQFRYAFGEVMLEVPAGKLDSKSEDWESAASRELSEETGMRAKRLIYLGDIRPSVAIFTEVIHMYAAVGLTAGEIHLDEDEFLENYTYSLDELTEMVMRGEITDAKTIASVLKVKRMYDSNSELLRV